MNLQSNNLKMNFLIFNFKLNKLQSFISYDINYYSCYSYI